MADAETPGRDLPASLIVVDADALGKLNEQTPRHTWVETLARGGLLARMANASEESEEGRILLEMRRLLVEWGGPVKEPTGSAWPAIPTSWVVGGAMAAAVVVGANLYFNTGGFFFLVLLAPIGYRVRGALASAPADRDAPCEQSPRLAQLVRRLLQRSFVTVIDGAVIEHIPHCAVLRSRLHDIDRAEGVLRARAAEIEGTRRDIARLNQQMGKPVEDAETTRLTTLLHDERHQLEGLGTMRAEIGTTLHRTEELLRELRLTAVRRSLSEKASRLAAGSASAGEAMAAAEVELSGYSARLHELVEETNAADARLRAMLELQGR